MDQGFWQVARACRPGSPVLQSSQGSGIPLSLNGCSITVVVNGVTVQPGLYYTSPTQVADDGMHGGLDGGYQPVPRWTRILCDEIRLALDARFYFSQVNRDQDFFPGGTREPLARSLDP